MVHLRFRLQQQLRAPQLPILLPGLPPTLLTMRRCYSHNVNFALTARTAARGGFCRVAAALNGPRRHRDCRRRIHPRRLRQETDQKKGTKTVERLGFRLVE